MSGELKFTLRCDHDPCECADERCICDLRRCAGAVIGRGITDEAVVRKVRRLARDLGWTCNETGDWCSDHRPKEVEA